MLAQRPQAVALHGLGCPLGQGFLFSRPVSGPAMTALLIGQAEGSRVGAALTLTRGG